MFVKLWIGGRFLMPEPEYPFNGILQVILVKEQKQQRVISCVMYAFTVYLVFFAACSIGDYLFFLLEWNYGENL